MCFALFLSSLCTQNIDGGAEVLCAVSFSLLDTQRFDLRQRLTILRQSAFGCVWDCKVLYACVLYICSTEGRFWSGEMMDCQVLFFFFFFLSTQLIQVAKDKKTTDELKNQSKKHVFFPIL